MAHFKAPESDTDNNYQCWCGGEWVESSAAFEACAQCGRERRNRVSSVNARRHVYKSIHYITALLKAYDLRDRRVPTRVVQRVRMLWRRAGSPPLTKPNLQTIMATRRSPTFRKYLRSWRQLAHRIAGIAPPRMSARARAHLLLRFTQVHGAYVKLPVFGTKRVSAMSTAFSLRRCLELCGMDRYRQWFPGLRGESKLVEHYKMWLDTCRMAGIPAFISVVI